MEYVFGAALAAVVVAAIGFTVYETLFKGPGGVEKAGNPHFKCVECGHEFEVENVPRDRMREAVDPAMALLDCPECGAEYSCMRMIRCRACDEYYIPQRSRYMAEHGVPAPDDVRDVCPHCGTDRLEWAREHR
jgi:hypothetical protein